MVAQLGTILHSFLAAAATAVSHPSWLAVQFGGGAAAVWLVLRGVSHAIPAKLPALGAFLQTAWKALRTLTVRDVEGFFRSVDEWIAVLVKGIGVVAWHLVSLGGALLAAWYLLKWLSK